MDSSEPASNAARRYLPVSKNPQIQYRPMPQPLSVYVPLKSLTPQTVDSIVSTVHQSETKDWHFGRRTLLAFLLAINETLTQIEQNPNAYHQFDEETIAHAPQVREWLVRKTSHDRTKPIDWDQLRDDYQNLLKQNDAGLAGYFQVDLRDVEPYYELIISGLHPDVNRSREYMAKFRSQGWNPDELKVYWDAKQLEDLCPSDKVTPKPTSEANADDATEQVDGAKEEVEGAKAPEPVTSKPFLHDPSDTDAVQNLRQYPVCERNHAVQITYVNKGIEKAVFDAPEDAQLIVLNFANERSPGGGYLRHAWAQEEIMLFNSDGYRSLLDLKYGRMGSGYVIPEFGTAYVRDIRFFEKGTERVRKADMLVSACYCISGSSQLFENPGTEKEWFDNKVAKFRAFIAAAVANTKGDGSNTYLLLGPIGTGAFGNDTKEIGYVFDRVLSSQMMGSTGPIRNAFGNIWFVSTDKWKNEAFETIFKDWSSDHHRF